MEIRDFYTPPGEKKKVSPPKDFWLYAILGWAGCFVAAVFLFSKMFGSFVEPESSSAYAFYGFISLVPGVIIGLLVYNAKKSAYEQYLRECQQENNNTIHPSTDSIQPINSAEYTKACPYCGEHILKAAKKCKHCGEWIKDEDKIVEVKKMDCPICGEEIDASSTLCPICHEAIKSEPEGSVNDNAKVKKSGQQESDLANNGRQIFIILIILAVVLIVIWQSVSNNSSNEPTYQEEQIEETENQEAALGDGDIFYNETKESENKPEYNVVYDIGPADYDYDDPQNSGDRYHEPPMYN